MSHARISAFAQRVASTILNREVAVTHEDSFRNMKVRAWSSATYLSGWLTDRFFFFGFE